MAEKCKDEELKAGLTQARKKPRNFVLIAKGSSAVKLIVQKKPIKAGDVQKAKADAKGNLVIEGVCQGEGTEMVFQVLGEEPSVKVLTIKELIGEETELTMKARFQVVNQLPQVLEDDDEVPEAPPAPPQGSTSNETPPPAPPPPPGQPTAADEDLLMMLISAMGKLGPRIQEAIKKFPNEREALVGGVGTFQKEVKAKNAQAARNAFQTVKDLVTKLIGEAPPQAPPQPTQTQSPSQSQAPPVAPPQPQADPKAAQWAKEWGSLEAQYEAALKTASSDLASKLRVIHAYATEQAEATQYDKALAALVRLRPLIDQASQGKGPAGEVVAGTVEKRKYMIERIKQLPIEVRPEIDKLKEAISSQVPDEDAEELCGEIEIALQELFNTLQDEIDDAINKGEMKMLDGVKDRILQNELVAHLVSNPMTEGVAFRQLIIKALDEVEAKLAG